VLAVLLLTLTRSFFDMDHWVLWRRAFLGFSRSCVVLNLLPIPGLDGYDALEPHLSPRHSARWRRQSSGCFVLVFCSSR